MKLKSLLLEQQIEAEAKKLHNLLKKGEYDTPKTELYRGKGEKVTSVLEKTTKSNVTRAPRNTKEYLDDLIDIIYMDCYPQFPRRKKSRFATTIERYARSYGKFVYVIYPHKNALISSIDDDPFDTFHSIDMKVKNMDFDKLTEVIRDEYDEVSEQTIQIYKLIYEAVNENLKAGDVKRLGCLETIVDKVKGLRFNDMEIEDLNLAIASVFISLKKYFESMELGYPYETLKMGGEVIFQGKYIQAPLDVQQKMLEMRRSGELS